MRGFVNPSFKDRAQVRGINFRDMMRTDATLAFDQCDNRFLRGWRLIGAVSGLTSNEGLVALDELAFAAKRPAIVAESEIGHRFADTVREEPRGLQADAENAVQLVGTHAFLAGCHQVHRLQPDMQLDVAGLEYGADLDSERLAAGVALIDPDPGALALEWPAFVDDAAVRAWPTICPQPRLNEPIGGFFTVKMWGGKDGRHGVSP